MIPLTLREVADAVGGTLHDADPGAVVAGTVEFDSRAVTAGGLFVALPGEKVDGHDFAAKALAQGAVAVLAARPVGGPAVVVPPVSEAHTRSVALTGDTDGSGAAVLAALAKLARVVVDRLTARGLTVVGVTGSSGKTSTKDLIAQVLAPMGPTVAPPGSFNSELGHPWTALRADEGTRYLVLELSARGPGHIAALCDTAPPRIGAVLNVGSAHLGEFGTREDIAKTKGELVEKLPEDGVAVLNADDPLVAAMASRTRARVVLVGEAAGAHVRAADIRLDEQARATFRLVSPQGEADVALGLHGAHHVGNALSAAAIALELGATPAEVAERLSGARRVSARRMEVITRPDGVTVVNDSYNANPESVRAALKTLATMARTGNRRRSWAVLGVMGELGDDHVAAHDEVGRLAVRLDINRLVVVGADARPMHQGASLEGSWGEESVLVADVDAAVALLRAELAPGDVVLVKASKVAALWRVADALLEAGE
ncbi:UDP-N-acetylmuramoyl-tripeptide--D-alanyl-D-alanine ligase [Actinokineospora bangkokensis]|uniref:UDP-N-acetylmuramoyl-tripeptide--D-alanyl-D-alanine ligase n=1 Tax=Actinokineospora bangkokensis TaxID=1193682 RepID=A0A1Q9LQ88_9PSEU|nr:UDP-N-acetylmuramoyl-tripeptide--D-alanyl-D-alanine ligase [Actinokineospora bangkokensis]OLR94190.1 UDP-N-acetylmuramoyl-tripeptide--D-alanyl-D-alanine ligase [Actinokineospora bangkokensis]